MSYSLNSKYPPLIMENQMEKKMENEMETAIYRVYVGDYRGYSLNSKYPP